MWGVPPSGGHQRTSWGAQHNEKDKPENVILIIYQTFQIDRFLVTKVTVSKETGPSKVTKNLEQV